MLSAFAALLIQGATHPLPAGVSTDSVPGSELTVYLLTFDPGPIIWERFGHNALWIRDHRQGSDSAYDYGRFSFGRTTADRFRFFGQFAKGLLNYSMGSGTAKLYLDSYARAGRSIWAQELDLPPAARQELREFLRWNDTDLHRDYRYNYYLDNCSTRLRDAIDRVVAGQLKAWADTVKTPWTYRDHTRRTTESDPLMYTLLNIGLGQPTDKSLTAWEEMFLPISLRPYLNAIQVRDPDGRVHSLVKEERHLVESDRFQVEQQPSNWLWRYAAIGAAVGLAFLALGRLGRASGRWRLVLGMVGGLWSLAAGLSGLALAMLWALTDHEFSYANENVLQLNVLSLLVAVAIPRGLVRGDSSRRRVLVAGSALVAGLSAAGLVLKALPVFDQSNFEIIALFLPIHLGLAAAIRSSSATAARSSPEGA